MTRYALLLEACGLSHREAADLHLVSLDTVKSWSTGRNAAPPAAIAELRVLAADIARRAVEALEDIRRLAKRAVILHYPVDDETARTLGFPCLGAWRAMQRRVVAELEIPAEFHPMRASS